MKTFLLLSIGAVLSAYGREDTVFSKGYQQVKGEELGDTATCSSVAWSCGENYIICGQEGRNNANCICAIDITGHTQCVKDRSCSSSPLCSEAGACASGSVCLKADNCCGKPVCVPVCNTTNTANPTTTATPTRITPTTPTRLTPTTPSPTPIPTPYDICSNGTWECGAPYCGSAGPFSACYCGTDVEGYSGCYMEESCSTQLYCTRNSDCPDGSGCMPSTCCPSPLCLPYCYNSTTPAPTRSKTPTTKAPTVRPPTTRPTTSSPTMVNTCASTTWSCGLSVTTCGDQGPLGCYCNQDERNDHYCIVNDYCDNVAACSDNNDCPSGSVCTPTCCGSGNCFLICDEDVVIDPLSLVLPVTSFSIPSEQDKLCAKSYLECRETCGQKFGRCTSQHGECSPATLDCAEQCKKAREQCVN